MNLFSGVLQGSRGGTSRRAPRYFISIFRGRRQLETCSANDYRESLPYGAFAAGPEPINSGSGGLQQTSGRWRAEVKVKTRVEQSKSMSSVSRSMFPSFAGGKMTKKNCGKEEEGAGGRGCGRRGKGVRRGRRGEKKREIVICNLQFCIGCRTLAYNSIHYSVWLCVNAQSIIPDAILDKALFALLVSPELVVLRAQRHG